MFQPAAVRQRNRPACGRQVKDDTEQENPKDAGRDDQGPLRSSTIGHAFR